MELITENYTFKTKKEAWDYVGGLSEPGKMPGYGWSISAKRCKRGTVIREAAKSDNPKIKAIFENSTCGKCYAMKGRYSFSNVQNSLENRFNALQKPLWVEAMSFLLKEEEYFRWFDSGDLQDIDHLNKIIEVCKNTPKCKHWLPTREVGILREFIGDADKNPFPRNLCVRISSDFINLKPVAEFKYCNISTTSDKEWYERNKKGNIKNCPVTTDHAIKSCDDAGKCRNCWNKNIYRINYLIH